MRGIAKDITWVGLFAVAMTGVVGVPIAALITVVMMVDNDAELIPLILIAAAFLFFLSLGLLGVLKHHHRLRERGVPTSAEQKDEAAVMQEMHQRSVEMDRRLESLETILLARSSEREHINR